MSTTEAPVWMCEVCARPLTENDGVIVVSYADISEFAEQSRAWEAAHPGPVHRAEDFDSHPRSVPWHVVHDTCGGEDRVKNPYTIASGRIDTWSKVASWSAHLHDKGWFAYTAWDDLVRGAGAPEA
jgi:hypothetical protein